VDVGKRFLRSIRLATYLPRAVVKAEKPSVEDDGPAVPLWKLILKPNLSIAASNNLAVPESRIWKRGRQSAPRGLVPRRERRREKKRAGQLFVLESRT